MTTVHGTLMLFAHKLANSVEYWLSTLLSDTPKNHLQTMFQSKSQATVDINVYIIKLLTEEVFHLLLVKFHPINSPFEITKSKLINKKIINEKRSGFTSGLRRCV